MPDRAREFGRTSDGPARGVPAAFEAPVPPHMVAPLPATVGERVGQGPFQVLGVQGRDQTPQLGAGPGRQIPQRRVEHVAGVSDVLEGAATAPAVVQEWIARPVPRWSEEGPESTQRAFGDAGESVVVGRRYDATNSTSVGGLTFCWTGKSPVRWEIRAGQQPRHSITHTEMRVLGSHVTLAA